MMKKLFAVLLFVSNAYAMLNEWEQEHLGAIQRRGGLSEISMATVQEALVQAQHPQHRVWINQIIGNLSEEEADGDLYALVFSKLSYLQDEDRQHTFEMLVTYYANKQPILPENKGFLFSSLSHGLASNNWHWFLACSNYYAYDEPDGNDAIDLLEILSEIPQSHQSQETFLFIRDFISGRNFEAPAKIHLLYSVIQTESVHLPFLINMSTRYIPPILHPLFAFNIFDIFTEAPEEIHYFFPMVLDLLSADRTAEEYVDLITAVSNALTEAPNPYCTLNLIKNLIALKQQWNPIPLQLFQAAVIASQMV